MNMSAFVCIRTPKQNYLSDVVRHGHACQFLLNGAKRVNATTELVSSGRVFHCLPYTGFHSPSHTRSHAEPTIVQNAHCHFEATTFHCTRSQQHYRSLATYGAI